MINHSSTLKAPLFAPPCKASRTSLTGVRRGKRRRDKADRVLLFELNRRADEMIGLEADNSGSFVVYFDRTAIEKDPNKTTSRPFLSYLRRHRLSRTRMGTFQCRTTKKCAPRPPHASRPPSRAAFPPASTSRPFSLLSALHTDLGKTRPKKRSSKYLFITVPLSADLSLLYFF